MKVEVRVGLVKGRHKMPVSEYIWDDVPDVFDYAAMDAHVASWLKNNVGIHVETGTPLNSAGYDDIEIYAGDISLVVYVTGLTACTTSLVKMCALNGIELTLMHYDIEARGYRPQRVF